MKNGATANDPPHHPRVPDLHRSLLPFAYQPVETDSVINARSSSFSAQETLGDMVYSSLFPMQVCLMRYKSSQPQ